MRFKIYTRKINHHLTDEEIARWVDAIEEDRVDELPGRILLHGEECLICKEKIVEINQSVIASRSDELPEADEKYRRQFSEAPVIPLFKVVRIAAAAVILIGIGTLMVLLLSPRKQDPVELFAMNFTPYPDLITEKSAIHETDTIHQWLMTGLGFYHAKKYDSAYIVFKHLYSKDRSSDTIAFYFANTILATNSDPGSAVKVFKSLSEGETVFAELSQWYLALALIKNNDIAGAKSQLAYLIRTSPYYRQKAETLLKKLE
jgi:hypothetical protein